MRLWVALMRCPASFKLSIASSRTVSSLAMSEQYGRASSYHPIIAPSPANACAPCLHRWLGVRRLHRRVRRGEKPPTPAAVARIADSVRAGYPSGVPALLMLFEKGSKIIHLSDALAPARNKILTLRRDSRDGLFTFFF